MLECCYVHALLSLVSFIRIMLEVKTVAFCFVELNYNSNYIYFIVGKEYSILAFVFGTFFVIGTLVTAPTYRGRWLWRCYEHKVLIQYFLIQSSTMVLWRLSLSAKIKVISRWCLLLFPLPIVIRAKRGKEGRRDYYSASGSFGYAAAPFTFPCSLTHGGYSLPSRKEESKSWLVIKRVPLRVVCLFAPRWDRNGKSS